MELRNENLTDLAEMKRQIQVLKNEIRKLGTVNVNAIEDYKMWRRDILSSKGSMMIW